jgi:endonuclease/exonuclease/phosphatase family metal-dependent hydrolase
MKGFAWIGGLLLVLAGLTGCQSAPPRLRVLTYNIRHGAGLDDKVDLARTARTITDAQPDLVALQEVDNKTQRTGLVDQAAELERLTGLHAAFGKAINYSGGQYGAGVLSRWPLLQITPGVLPASPGHEMRPALLVRVRPGHGIPELVFASTHLDHQSEPERLMQVERLFTLLGPREEQPIILGGDFNAVPTSAVLEFFAKDWLNPTAGATRLTIPAEQPRNQIDYVLAYPKGYWRVVETEVLASTASDHRPLLVTLEWVK